MCTASRDMRCRRCMRCRWRELWSSSDDMIDTPRGCSETIWYISPSPNTRWWDLSKTLVDSRRLGKMCPMCRRCSTPLWVEMMALNNKGGKYSIFKHTNTVYGKVPKNSLPLAVTKVWKSLHGEYSVLPFNRARHLYSVDGENSISCIKFPVLLMTLLLFDVSVHWKSVNSILQKFFSGSRSTVVSRNAE